MENLRPGQLVTENRLQLRHFLQALRTPGFLIYLGGYAALLAWFKLADVYHTQFATRGAAVAIYNGFRVLFIFYLFWIVYGVGALALRWTAGFGGLRTIERLVLGFFAGAGVWHVGLLALGYLKLYTVPIAIAITVPAIALSYPSARDAISDCWRRIPPWRSVRWHERLMVASIGVAGLLLLLIKGLYPGGGHDYYTHYFYYYQTVIDQGGLWPNEVWYHYYYSKGYGLFFLGMLLTDPLAPQLVTFCFMAVSATALYLIVEDFAPRTSWPSASAFLFVGAYIFTPGWADFEKDHEIKTALIVGVIWMAQRLFQGPDKASAKFILACGLSVAAAIIVNTQIGLYFGVVFALLAIIFMTRGERRNVLVSIGLGAWAGTIVAGTLVLNYVTAGLPIDQGITWLWPLADVEKLYMLGSLPMVLGLHWGTKGLIAQGIPLFSLRTYKLVVQSFRLDLLYPLIIPAIGIAATSILTRKKTDKQDLPKFASSLHFYAFTVVAVCALAGLVICLAIGRTQPVSFHRYSTFAVPITILMGALLWNMPILAPKTPIIGVIENRWTPLAIAGCCLLAIAIDTRLYRHRDVITQPLAYAVGARSIDDAYVMQASWSYHMPWGAIYPAARTAYAIVGPHTPIWTLNMHSYCMLPHCWMESLMNFSMTRRWDRVMLGSVGEAQQVLRDAGINYFLFSRELGIIDPLPLSSLFSPDNIAHNLALRWTDGTTSLLTWPGPDTRPLDDAWVAAYRQSVNTSDAVQRFPLPYADMRSVYERYYAKPHPWKAIPLPW
jgi:hypothetical protein